MDGWLSVSSLRYSWDDQRRRYYRLTDFGERVLAAETERLEQLLEVARAKQRRQRVALTPSEGGL